jgi:hypothetical protein
VRALLTKEGARDIAIAAASTGAWDEHFIALAAGTGLRIHFSHGIPALSTRDGQRCAALADILLRWLSESRVRRLVSLCTDKGGMLAQLPQDWLTLLPRGATLLTLLDWQRALGSMRMADGAFDLSEALLPWLNLLGMGIGGAQAAAGATLRGRARRIWDAATRSAPAEAVELTLQNLRLPDESDASDSVVWCPAAHLAACPRRWMRLLGLTSHGWPRRGAEDPILPDHLVPARELDSDQLPESDRRDFAVLWGAATGGLVLSRSRRSPQGHRIGPSPLLPRGTQERMLSRARIPDHAFSEPDRLMARPKEAEASNHVLSATRCWRNWHLPTLTPHDGRFNADHALVLQALTRLHSATSLRSLLREPLGFLWKYALGWHAPEEREQPLTIAPDELGKLVHELLRRTVDALEPTPGFAAARDHEIAAAMEAAAAYVRDAWPLERPVPPRTLWTHTVAYAAQMGIAALKASEITQADTQSWTEVPFGDLPSGNAGRILPWDVSLPVIIPGTQLRIQGIIDRLDLRSAAGAVRVTDYKTGERPPRPEGVVIRGGAELQRALYGLACRQLLTECRHVVAQLAYLSAPPLLLKLDDLDAALSQIGAFVNVACQMLKSGVALPGPDAELATNEQLLAMPASPAYQRRKAAKFAQAANPISSFWNAR